jgi:predicted lipoprotein
MAKKKVTIERKPMKVKRTRKISEEQREALRERMKEMRKKRKPAEYKNVNERVLALPDDDTYSFKNVKEWIKHNKEMVEVDTLEKKNAGLRKIRLHLVNHILDTVNII